MECESIGEIIASRMLHVVDEHGHKRPVSVFIGKPQPLPNSSGYECPYQIIGIGTQETYTGRGRDAIQALRTAMIFSKCVLRSWAADSWCRISPIVNGKPGVSAT